MRRLTEALRRASVSFTQGRDPVSGLPLPPMPLRAAGPHFRSNRDFVAAAYAEARRLVNLHALDKDTRLVDLGCGAGRLAIGIAAELGAIRSYCGIDVGAPVIDWCQRHLAPNAPFAEFRRIDVYNERYNPTGAEVGQGYRLPVGDAGADTVYAYSLFSHMVASDVVAYLAEIGRVLDDGGRAVVTAFVERGVPDQAVNPAGYGPRTWRGALHCVRFNRDVFESLVTDAGLHVADFRYGGETDGQSLYVLAPGPAPAS